MILARGQRPQTGVTAFETSKTNLNFRDIKMHNEETKKSAKGDYKKPVALKFTPDMVKYFKMSILQSMKYDT